MWKKIEPLIDGVSKVVYVGVHALAWKSYMGEPTVGFARVDEAKSDLACVTAERDALREKSEWLPYPENKPENDTEYLVQTTNNVIFLADGSEFEDVEEYTDHKIIAFRPLPEPYKTPESEE